MKKAVFIFIILLLCSCVDYTKGESNVCPVHGKKMIKVIQPIMYGLKYGNANKKYTTYESSFCKDTNSIECPYAGNYVIGGCIIRAEKFAIAYSCGSCRKTLLKQKQKFELCMKGRQTFRERHQLDE